MAGLAVQVAEAGNPNLRGDAVTGAVLAAASARSAASLVDINVGWAAWIPTYRSAPRQAAADAGVASAPPDGPASPGSSDSRLQLLSRWPPRFRTWMPRSCRWSYMNPGSIAF